MQLQNFKQEVSRALSEFAWRQWSQMGVLSSFDQTEKTPIDPEALLLFSLEIGRDNPRLHEEVSDWFVANRRIVSLQRLRNLSMNKEDRALVNALLGWASEFGPRRTGQQLLPIETEDLSESLDPFFRDSSLTVNNPDPSYLAADFLKERTQPSGKSESPNLLAPINFAFRLRAILGNSVRSELVRVLCARQNKSMSVRDLSEATAYSKRNVQESISELLAARVILEGSSSGAARYELPSWRWSPLLFSGADIELVEYKPWPNYLFACRTLNRWLWEASESDGSQYLLSSSAALLVEDLWPYFAGRSEITRPGRAGDADFSESFEMFVRDALSVLS